MASTNYLNAKNGIEILHQTGQTQILAGSVDPTFVGIEASIGSIYLYSSISGTIYKKTGISSTSWTPDYDFQLIKNFIDLLDTPTTYSGHVGKYPRVNAIGDGLEFNYIEFNLEDPDTPLIPETAISGTYFVNFEGGRLLVGATGNKPDLVYNGPVAGLAFDPAKKESCYGSFKIPYAWNTESDIKVTINFMNDLAQIGTTVCSWRMSYHSYSEGDRFTDKITTIVDINYTFPSNAPAGTFWTHTLYMNSNSINNPLSRGDIVAFQFYRDGLSLQDTMVGDCILITLMIELNTGQHLSGDT